MSLGQSSWIAIVICLVSFLDYGILERHNQLDDTIGVLAMEMESYELSKLMAWIFYPTWILLTIIQAVCFILYNGKFHPLSKILSGCNIERKGMSQSKNLDYLHILSILYILSFIYFSIHLFIQQITLQGQKDIGFQMSIQKIWRVKHNVASLMIK